jgi:uncharacterized protein
MLFALLLLVASAAAMQRITGVGFSLICAPFFVLITSDPTLSVLTLNATSAVLNLLVLLQTWRSVRLKSVVLLGGGALLAIPFGQYIVTHASASVLSIVIGGMVLFGLCLLRYDLTIRAWEPWASICAGALSGFMNVTSGVGGPAFVLYAAAQKWEQKQFVASAQLYFLIVNLASVAAADPARIALGEFATLSLSLLFGVFAGFFIVARVEARRARTASLVIAALGAIATVVKGILSLAA